MPRVRVLLSCYLWGLGCLLFVQGLATVIARAVWPDGDTATHGALNHDAGHGFLHIFWGVFLLGLMARGARPWLQARVATIFGVFYTALGCLGVLVHNPFGLQLGVGENGFHFIVGPLALGLGLLALREAGGSSRAVAEGRAAESGS